MRKKKEKDITAHDLLYTIDFEALWNLCIHSYFRGATHGSDGKASLRKFNDFVWNGENSLWDHVIALQKDNKLKAKVKKK